MLDKRDVLFAGFSIFLFILIILALYKESNPEWPERSIDWRDYQREYYKKLAVKLNDEKIAETPLRVQQIWNEELNKADRCMTCHMGINKSIFSDEEHPYKSHPHLDDYISKHPFEKFGCTICHQGNGQTVKYTQTHGHVEYLDWQPLAGVYVQSSCTKCHTEMFAEDTYFPEAPVLMKGKRLLFELGCTACHTIRQFGATGTLAPDLSNFGSKTELSFFLVHDFTYHNLRGEHTMRNWEWEHFKEPRRIMPGNPEQNLPPTIMPNFGLNDEEVTALTVLMFSLKDPKIEKVPVSYLPELEENHKEFMQFRQ